MAACGGGQAHRKKEKKSTKQYLNRERMVLQGLQSYGMEDLNGVSLLAVWGHPCPLAERLSKQGMLWAQQVHPPGHF